MNKISQPPLNKGSQRPPQIRVNYIHIEDCNQTLMLKFSLEGGIYQEIFFGRKFYSCLIPCLIFRVSPHLWLHPLGTYLLTECREVMSLLSIIIQIIVI